MTAYILTLQYFRINLKYRNCGSKSIKNLSYQSADLRGLYISLQAQKVNNVLAPDRGVAPTRNTVGVHGFKGSRVQSSILVPGLQLGYIFTRKASASSGVIQDLEPNWQLLGKMSLFNEALGSSMPSFSLTPGPDLACNAYAVLPGLITSTSIEIAIFARQVAPGQA